MSRGFTPRHAEMVGDLGFAMQFNAETPNLICCRRITIDVDGRRAQIFTRGTYVPGTHSYSENTKHLYNISTTSVQRLRYIW